MTLRIAIEKCQHPVPCVYFSLMQSLLAVSRPKAQNEPSTRCLTGHSSEGKIPQLTSSLSKIAQFL